MMDFETFHAERERIRKEQQDQRKEDIESGLQQYLEDLQERRRRSDDYIAYLLAKGEEKRLQETDTRTDAEKELDAAIAKVEKERELREAYGRTVNSVSPAWKDESREPNPATEEAKKAAINKSLRDLIHGFDDPDQS